MTDEQRSQRPVLQAWGPSSPLPRTLGKAGAALSEASSPSRSGRLCRSWEQVLDAAQGSLSPTSHMKYALE
ncbi:hypothetical protein G6O69_07435 [Pseudenhygromyxa sp. WMMC2535]|uniref:hypothetical protein n=1 Tax=Pseudenhygromyxa sp. WMMC2535 TaxID=2712867 RepID=UPI0015958116|nr:hypothetical protein [Pseudenhygromyxa sp. WMMC2535]NVB37660.1 hypothetical protein [Pseudenhygromyxa sp. WMMC2535]